MKDRLTVLMVHNYYQIPGGEETVVFNEKRLLEEHGCRVIFYSRDNSEIKSMSALQKLKLPFTTIFNLKTYKDIKGLIKKEKVDVVHVHNTLNLISPAVYYAAVRCRVPVVQTMHNFRVLCPGAEFYRDGRICEDCVRHGLMCAIKHGCYRGSKAQTLICVISMLMQRCTGIYRKMNFICLTDFNKDKLLSLGHIVNEQVFVKPNFTYEPPVKNEQDDFYLFIGRIEDIKGIPVLLEAFKRMPQRLLKIAGTGTMLEKYRQAGFDNVEFLGYLSREDVNKQLKRAKAVVVTSQWYETFGMMVVEAFASGVPVIVGDIGNVGALVDDGIDGLKFKYDSYEALICAIERFESLDRDVLCKNAYKKYSEYFAPKKNFELLSSIYAKVVDGKEQ